MTTWMTISAAADKYEVETTDICFWASVGEICYSVLDETYLISDESIQEFLSQRQIIPNREYICTLERICKNQSATCEVYIEVIELQKHQIEQLEGMISQIGRLKDLMETHDERMKETAAMTSSSATPESGWIEHLWKKITGLDPHS